MAQDYWQVHSATDRLALSRRRAAAAADEIRSWFALRRPDQRFARFAGHFDVLESVLLLMRDRVAAEHDAVDVHAPPGAVHDRCREIETSLDLVRRIFRWYRDKYDQRLVDRPTLSAADEVVRSCWTEPFARLGRRPPTGPLVYLDARFDASATPRVSVPPDLRGPDDDVVARCVLELPVPVIALPAVADDEPWWLVLSAHETGHHVQHDLGLVRDTGEALAGIAPDDSADHWHGWAREAFADAYSVLMVGTAAGWAVGELEFGRPERLARVPRDGDRYPPPCVRTALLGELARVLDLDDPGPGTAEVGDWLAACHDDAVPPPVRARLARYLDTTPAAARALVDLPVDGIPLRELCGFDAAVFDHDAGRVGTWARALAAPRPVLAGQADREAARIGVAGGVAAYRSAPGDGTVVGLLRDNLAVRLAACGPAGVLAPPAAADPAAIAARLTGEVLAAGRQGEG